VKHNEKPEFLVCPLGLKVTMRFKSMGQWSGEMQMIVASLK